jgi:alkylation response protein AidB-like acyl-CoA dehydrogenase
MYVLNDEETLLAGSAADFFASRSPVSAFRHLRDSNDPTGFDRGLWREMAGLGWTGLLVDEAHGGTGFGHRGTAIIARAMGRHLVASPFLSTAVLGSMALAHASDDMRKLHLPRLVEGELILALALDETPRYAPAFTAMTAIPDGDAFVLSGEKCAVIDGHVADCLLVATRTAPGPQGRSLFLVDRKQPGISVDRLSMIDNRNLARIRFDGVRLAAAQLVGSHGEARAILAAVLDAGHLALAAELLGIAEEVFARTLDYLRQRRQFGVPIGSFQALQHRASLIHCQIELAHSAVMAAARKLDAGSADASLQVSVARVKAADAAILATDEAVQMHGGIGMTDELDIGLFLKRARVASTLLGTPAYHTDRAACLLGF